MWEGRSDYFPQVGLEVGRAILRLVLLCCGEAGSLDGSGTLLTLPGCPLPLCRAAVRRAAAARSSPAPPKPAPFLARAVA